MGDGVKSVHVFGGHAVDHEGRFRRGDHSLVAEEAVLGLSSFSSPSGKIFLFTGCEVLILVQLIHNFRLNEGSLSHSTPVTKEFIITHTFLNKVKVAFSLGLHEGLQVGVDFDSGSESVTQTKVIFVLSVFS